MFNRITTIAREPSSIEFHSVVHEHRAPTDASVRLLREMVANARAEVVEAVAVTDNTFNCVVHRYKDFLSDTLVLVAIWSLNGRKQKTDYVAPSGVDARSMALGLRDKMAVDIANYVLEGALKLLSKTL